MTLRKTIATYGPKGRIVRVFTERDMYARVQWRESGIVKTRSWDNTRAGKDAAKAFAQGLVEVRDNPAAALVAPPPAPLTVRMLWERYTVAEFKHLRKRTMSNYTEHWENWERFAGARFAAEAVTAELLDEFRDALIGLQYAVSQQRKNIELVKQVFRWGVLRELVSRDRLSLHRFKVAKEDRPDEIPEYTPAEYQQLVPQFDPHMKTQWRAWALLVLIGELGPRINAACHLRWDDVDFSTEEFGTVTWRARYDKQGRERVQPLTPAARDALYVALGWSRDDLHDTGWVFFSSSKTRYRNPKSDGTYTVQGFSDMLRKAEIAAGVTHAPGGGAHRMRRMAAGNALEVTGNVADAMWWIGDTDLRQAQKYLKKRDHRMRDVARGIGSVTGNPGEHIPKECPPTATRPQPSTKTKNASKTSDASSRCDAETYIIDCIAPQVGLEPTTL